MKGLTSDEVKRLIARTRDVTLTPNRKTQLSNLADDILSDFSSEEDLAAKFALFVALVNRVSLVP